MMELKMNWTVLLVIVFSIGPSFSSMYFRFISHLPQDYYESSWATSVHRGLLLSYSPAKKYETCRDLFSELFTDKTREISELIGTEPLITDEELRNQGDPEYSLIVGKVTAIGAHSPRHKGEDLFLQCVGKYFGLRYQESIVRFVSSAFQPGLMYDVTEDSLSYRNRRMTLKRYIGMSPEFVLLERDLLEIETQYATIRQKINALVEESPEYVRSIENNDTLSTLSLWQKFLLCSSIILSPIYETNRSKFPLDWDNYKEYAATANTPKRLTFANNEYSAMEWLADCVYCSSTGGEASDPSTIPINLLLTRAYDNNYSVYVLIEKDGFTTFGGYVKNVPILMNARVSITDDPPSDFRLRL